MPSSEQEEKRRKYLLLMLAMLVSDTGDALNRIAMSSLSNPSVNFYSAGMLLLRSAHADAARLGRTLAGGRHPFDMADRFAGESAAEEQGLYLLGFDTDLANGRYIDNEGAPKEAQIAQRSNMYGLSLVGTANDAWRRSLPTGTEVWWMLDPSESQHCEGCPAIAAQNPWRAEALPTVPGAGNTPCLAYCKCSLKTSDGQEAFPGGTTNV